MKDKSNIFVFIVLAALAGFSALAVLHWPAYFSVTDRDSFIEHETALVLRRSPRRMLYALAPDSVRNWVRDSIAKDYDARVRAVQKDLRRALSKPLPKKEPLGSQKDGYYEDLRKAVSSRTAEPEVLVFHRKAVTTAQEDVLRKMQMLKEHMEEDRASLSRKLLGRSESDDRLSGYNDRELARLRREALVLGYTVPVRIRYRDAGRDTSQVFLLVHADEFAYKPALWEVQGRYKPKTYPAVSVLVKREFYYEPLFEKRFWEPWHKFLKAEEDRYYRNGRRW